jgi:RimJ/RimL family protein N-acetyltransferase
MRSGGEQSEPPCIVLDDLFVLSGWLSEDAVAHRRFALDADSARFFGWTVEEARSAPDEHYEDVIRYFQREWQEGTRYCLAIRRRSDGEAVGSVELRPVGGQAEVSFMVAAELRRQGLGTRALHAMLAWGARELGLRQASLRCHLDNAASQRVAEKCGFIFVGRQDDEMHFRRDAL